VSTQNKIVIVVSPGNSGGGAIHDYLLSRSDFISPFQGEEFRLIIDPYGLENLYKNLYLNFSINNSSDSFFQFEQYCYYLSKLKSTKNGQSIYGKNFYNLSLEYLKRIELLSYKGIPQFKRISLDFQSKNIYKIKKKIFKLKNHEHNLYLMKLAKNKKFFFQETSHYLKNIFISNLKNLKKKIIVLDQATNFWKPEIVIKYFNNCKIILVTRDPRSVFYSMKSRGSFAYPGYDIKIFVKWYRLIMQLRNKMPKKFKNNIMEIKFEDFINNFDKETKKINSFLGIEKKVINNFDYQNSLKNVYKAQKYLNKSEKLYIEKKLKNYLQW